MEKVKTIKTNRQIQVYDYSEAAANILFEILLGPVQYFPTPGICMYKKLV